MSSSEESLSTDDVSQSAIDISEKGEENTDQCPNDFPFSEEDPAGFRGRLKVPDGSLASSAAPEASEVSRKSSGARNSRENAKEWKLESDSKREKYESKSLGGDICRICHMGGFPVLNGSPQQIWEWQNQNPHRGSEISNLSSFAYLGPLISACKCRGTVGLVHAECLERWLTESGHSRCELCGHKYVTRLILRHGFVQSLFIWFKSAVATRQVLLDAMYLIITTPLALLSCYICGLALRLMVETGFYDIPWVIVAMLPTCSLTMIAYWGWVVTLGRIHGRRWRRFWRNNFVVRLVPRSSTYNPRAPVNDLNAIANMNETLQERELRDEEFIRML